MIEGSDFRIERLTAKNLSDLSRLYLAVYEKKSPDDYFIKKYNTAYTGVSFIGYIAYNGDLPIAYYGVIPCFLKQKETTILTAQSVDTMTHPDYRYKGLFLSLMNRTIELSKAEGIKLFYGFPNQNSLNGFIKTNWIVQEYMDCFFIKTKSSFMVKLLRKLSFLRRTYLWYISLVLRPYRTDHPGLSNSVTEDGSDGILRTDAYLKQKTYSPTQVIRIGKSLIWIKLQNRVTIGDMMVDDDDFDIVINTLKKLAYQLGLNQIMFQTSPGTRLHRLFSAGYSSFQTFPVIFYPLSPEVSTDNIKFTFADIDIF